MSNKKDNKQKKKDQFTYGVIAGLLIFSGILTYYIVKETKKK